MTLVVDNHPVTEGMNRGFGSLSLLCVLMGKIRSYNLGINCHTTVSFFINDSCTDAPGSQINFSRTQTDIPTTERNTWHKTTCVYCVSGMQVNPAV